MEYQFSINDFEGPLDLLLHLVKTSKMNIYDIDIKIIIEEYLKFIESEKEKNIDIASSYLVMASELIHLKSKMLVNDEESEPETDDEFSITSEEDLKRKILEYEKYKKISENLVELESKRIYLEMKEKSKTFIFSENREGLYDLNTGMSSPCWICHRNNTCPNDLLYLRHKPFNMLLSRKGDINLHKGA